MPGVVGHLLDRKWFQTSRKSSQDKGLPRDCSESEIFYRLSLGRVCYSYPAEKLYFVSSSHVRVDQILEAALKGLGKTPVIEQLHLDLHRLFSAARRAALPAADAGTVLSALRLAGVTVLLIR